MHEKWEIVGEIKNIEVIAVGSAIRVLNELQEEYGAGKWRKLKGFAMIRFANGGSSRAEIHWYEANGIGRKRLKIKRLLH